MAAAYNDKIKQMVTQRSAEANAAVQNGAVNQTAAPQVTPYTGLAGVSENTQNILGKYGAGYTPSAAVSQAQKYLSDVVAGKPGAYQSGYKQQLDDLYNQVMNRPQFSYNAATDPMYAQYRDQYMNLGNQAMMDTTAQAAALTGGYGNSYAATAGNQAYQAYLQQLNNVVPDLYQMAMQRYQQEGDDLNTRYGMTAELENQDYGRYQQDLANWQAEREAANADYWNQYNADYGQYADQMDYWSQMAAQENAQWNTNRELAYNQAMAIIKTGKTPSAALLATAGISAADAKTLAKAYAPKSSSGGGGGGSSRKSSSGSGGSNNSTGGSNKNTSSDVAFESSWAAAAYNDLAKKSPMDSGSTAAQKVEAVEAQVRAGLYSPEDGKRILDKLGI